MYADTGSNDPEIVVNFAWLNSQISAGSTFITAGIILADGATSQCLTEKESSDFSML
jgi:hypothetical protein